MQHTSLNAVDWLDLALNELKEHGYAALKALPLAKKLNVSRGSFYHHFRSLDDFHGAVIAHWSKRSSDDVIQAAVTANDPKRALDELLQRTLRSGEQLERAVRSWATVEPLVARAVQEVDGARIKVAEDLLVGGGIPPDLAAPRARLLYWGAIGRLMLPFPDQNVLTSDEISGLAMLMWHD